MNGTNTSTTSDRHANFQAPPGLYFNSKGQLMAPLTVLALTKREALRGVDLNSTKYQDVAISIRKFGVLTPLHIEADPERPGCYGVLNGRQRFTAAENLELDAVPVTFTEDGIVEDGSEGALALMIASNAHVPTSDADVMNVLKAEVGRNPGATTKGLAEKFGLSLARVDNLLKLKNLGEELQQEILEGNFNLGKGVLLLNLPADERQEFMELGREMSTADFSKAISNRKKELDKADAEARKANPIGFVPSAKLRDKTVIEAAILNPGPIVAELKANGGIADDSPAAVATGLLKWVVTLDPAGITAAEAAYNTAKETAAANRQAKKDAREALARQTKDSALASVETQLAD